MWFADLSPCTYFPTDVALTAVGWLERGKPYVTGKLDHRVYEALVAMRKDPWEPWCLCGLHECDLCQSRDRAVGSANLFIPGDDVLYVCPELIVHYIDTHGYAPPEIFCRSVLICPPMGSMSYLRAIESGGGSQFLRPPGE